MRTVPLILTTLLIATLSSPVDAQELDGQWFKVVAVGNGVGVDAETGDTEKFKTKQLFIKSSANNESHESPGGDTRKIASPKPRDIQEGRTRGDEATSQPLLNGKPNSEEEEKEI